ncbi:MAG: sugar O-acetyltransferase [Bacilli bacterium]|nr:sugar O-acetyltransferase [Bacilli bacterium]
MDNPFFKKIDTEGSARDDEPIFQYAYDEMVRSHELSLKISQKKPTDPDYHGLLEELFQTKVDPSVAIVSPFYCDCGPRVKLGKDITINKGATFLSFGILEIQDGVLIGPEVKVATVNHDLYDRRHLCHFKQVTICKNAWIGMGAILCPGVTVGENAVVAAGAVVTKDVPPNTVVGGNPAKVIKEL